MSDPCCLHPCQACRAALVLFSSTNVLLGLGALFPSVPLPRSKASIRSHLFSGIYPQLPNMNPMYVPPPPPYSGPSPAGPAAPPGWMGPGMPGKRDWGAARAWVQKGAWAVGGVVGTAWGGEAAVVAGQCLALLFEITEWRGSCSALRCTACGQLWPPCSFPELL